MDLEYFFAGTQSKEERSSPILATLLRYDHSFRRIFMCDRRKHRPITEGT
jgi:hypothetical protein